ncbi:MAG: ComF family protein [Leptospiraceae bacterium]|nr:ComF family protein [Leptospiraceae bacterium]MCP5493240.1 ComF family protein [Leptospiraceae bacterium]
MDILSRKIGICKKCYHGFPKEAEENGLCEICKTPLSEETCDYCNSRNIFFSELIFLRLREKIEKELIQNIKFHNKPYLSLYFRIGLRKKIRNWRKKQYQAIVYISSNKKTLKKRPIHPCKHIIDYLTKLFGIRAINPFQKVSSQLQSGKSYRDRFVHAASAFQIRKKYENKLKGKYLLVDDVFTTGATINELAKILLMNGSESVDVLVMTKGKQTTSNH